jgi:hypothetical protein
MSHMPSAADFALETSRTPCKQPGHIFRDKIIDKCAVIETWAVAILDQMRRSAVAPPKRTLHFLGLKVSAIKKCAEREPSLLKRPTKVIELLDALQPFIELRSDLAHAVLDVAVKSDGKTLFVFEFACKELKSAGLGRLVFTECEMRETTAQLAELANQISQQKAACAPNPAS